MTNNKPPKNVYNLQQSEFRAISGNPWVYWLNPTISKLYRHLPQIGGLLNPVVGCFTCDNNRFLRYWWEIGLDGVNRSANSRQEFNSKKKRWAPYMKGGTYLKWFGNQDHVVNFYGDGKEIREHRLISGQSYSLPGEKYYFKEGVTWGDLNPKGFAVRYLPIGFIFDVKGSSGFPNKEDLLFIMSVINSKWMDYSLGMLNPTASFQVGDISRVPLKAPSKIQRKTFDGIVYCIIQIHRVDSFHSETTFDFCFPNKWYLKLKEEAPLYTRVKSIESQINDLVYDLYELSDVDRQAIDNEIAGGESVSGEEENRKAGDEEDENKDLSSVKLLISWLSYVVGVVFGRFQPGNLNTLGSAIYRRTDFAIGSIPEPTEEEFNELIGDPSQFAYIDEQGGRHVFSQEVEQALQKLAVPDGITVFDPNHPRDLPTLVNKALELMLGQKQAQEVIQQSASGDLRKFLEKDFFTQHHIKQYRKRPVYWPIQSSKRSYGFVLFHEKIDRNTFYALQQEPYLATKRKAVQFQLEDLSKKALNIQGSARKEVEKRIDELRQLGEELTQFAKDLEEITSGGYVPDPDWIDDGVILRMAPLWKVIPLWKNEPKKYWEALSEGKYDWSQIAMKYWPERVKQACMNNKSYAIAHGHEEWFEGGR